MCVAEKDVPYTTEGNVVWRREPCGGEAMEGSKFCRWHHRDDYLRPETIKGFVMPNVRDHRHSAGGATDAKEEKL